MFFFFFAPTPFSFSETPESREPFSCISTDENVSLRSVAHDISFRVISRDALEYTTRSKVSQSQRIRTLFVSSYLAFVVKYFTMREVVNSMFGLDNN